MKTTGLRAFTGFSSNLSVYRKTTQQKDLPVSSTEAASLINSILRSARDGRMDRNLGVTVATYTGRKNVTSTHVKGNY